ncbi:MAG TPA: ABC transporter permease, partial [Pseudonocardiaceae bacterium]
MLDTELTDVVGGLDALETAQAAPRPKWRRIAKAVLPPVIAAVVFIAIWQALWASAIWPEYQLPAPAAVGRELLDQARGAHALAVIWVSFHRAALGFVMGVAIGTPLGLALAKVPVLRSAF